MVKAQHKRRQASKLGLDPEPFAIVTGIAGIVGGLSGALSLIRTYAPVSLKASHRQTILILESAIAKLAELETHTEGMERIIARGIDLGMRPYWFGSRVILVPMYFDEYSKHADGVMQLLRNLVKDTHKLERRFSILEYVDRADMQEVIDLQVQIEEILQGRKLGAADTLGQIRAVIARARRFAEEVRRELEGGRKA